MYVPTLVEQIYNHSDSPVNLKGFAVGNGVIGHEDTYPGSEAVDVSFLHNSRFVSEELWNEIVNACGPELTRPGLKCEQLKRRAEEGAGDYYIYNVYDTCGEDQVKVDADKKDGKPWLRVSPARCAVAAAKKPDGAAPALELSRAQGALRQHARTADGARCLPVRPEQGRC